MRQGARCRVMGLVEFIIVFVRVETAVNGGIQVMAVVTTWGWVPGRRACTSHGAGSIRDSRSLLRLWGTRAEGLAASGPPNVARSMLNAHVVAVTWREKSQRLNAFPAGARFKQKRPLRELRREGQAGRLSLELVKNPCSGELWEESGRPIECDPLDKSGRRISASSNKHGPRV